MGESKIAWGEGEGEQSGREIGETGWSHAVHWLYTGCTLVVDKQYRHCQDKQSKANSNPCECAKTLKILRKRLNGYFRASASVCA